MRYQITKERISTGYSSTYSVYDRSTTETTLVRWSGLGDTHCTRCDAGPGPVSPYDCAHVKAVAAYIRGGQP